MKKNIEKSNAQHLRKILTDVKGLAPHIGDEAVEFLDAIEEEINDKDDEIAKLKEAVIDLEYEADGPSYKNTSDLGLDTLHWKLENGNLVLDGLVEDFIESVQRKYSVIPA